VCVADGSCREAPRKLEKNGRSVPSKWLGNTLTIFVRHRDHYHRPVCRFEHSVYSIGAPETQKTKVQNNAGRLNVKEQKALKTPTKKKVV
jgi:hypothetical protein